MKRHTLSAALVFIALAAVPALAPARAQAPASYTFTDLGVLKPAQPYAVANAINSAGQIAGESKHPDGVNLRAFRITPAIVGGQQVWFQDGGGGLNSLMQTLALPNRYRWSFGRAINAAGEVGGEGLGNNHTLPQNAFFFGVSSTGQAITGTQSWGYGINDSGYTTGTLFPGGAALWQKVSGKKGPAWNQTALGTLPGHTSSNGSAINNSRQVAGVSNNGTPSFDQSFIWLPSPAYGLPQGMNSLGSLPGHEENFAEAINGLGQVAGGSYDLANTTLVEERAYLWLPSDAYGLAAGLRDIHDPAWLWSYAEGMNEAPGGVLRVVGHGRPSGSEDRAFVWDSVSQTMTDLNTVTANLPVGALLFTAYDVNDAGQIVGGYLLPNGVRRAFVLNPIP